MGGRDGVGGVVLDLGVEGERSSRGRSRVGTLFTSGGGEFPSKGRRECEEGSLFVPLA